MAAPVRVWKFCAFACLEKVKNSLASQAIAAAIRICCYRLVYVMGAQPHTDPHSQRTVFKIPVYHNIRLTKRYCPFTVLFWSDP